MSDAEANKVTCGSVPSNTGNGVKQATFKEGPVSLPDPGGEMAGGSAPLTAWGDWRRVLC